MYSKNGDYYLQIPTFLVRNNLNDESKKPGVLMVYCLIARYGTFDGMWESNLISMGEKIGLHFEKKKGNPIPSQIKNLKYGLEYLQSIGELEIKSGDFYQYTNNFCVKLKNHNFKEENYVALNINNFDYIMFYDKRINKANMLYTLLFVLSCYTVKDYEKKELNHCCSYSLKYLSKILGFGLTSVYKYLNALSCTGSENKKCPLIKSNKFTVKFPNGQYIHLPSIYTENKDGYKKIIDWQKKYLKNKLLQKEYNGFNETDDFDDVMDLY